MSTLVLELAMPLELAMALATVVALAITAATGLVESIKWEKRNVGIKSKTTVQHT